MYQEPPGGAAPINSWTRLNSAAGTITSGGTASIDTVTAMNVYDGRLYIGTNKANSGEIYRYDEDKSWVKVSQNTAGTIASAGTGSIDDIAVLIPYNHNSLFAGTMEGTSAEGYTYNVSIDQSYALKFNSGATTAGGIQGNNQNYGSIYFVASLSANLNNKQGNTGTFVFDHSIMSTNGSYDVAEDYPTRDDTLEAGDVVSIDTNERGFVVKSNGEYDYTAIGVYSEKPALRLSQDDDKINGGIAVPIALAGRAPVKVSTENGEIKQGDPLTPSSIPGVAMKAKKSGLIVGQAMEGFSGAGVGKVLAYIKSTSYSGSIAESFTNIDLASSSASSDILAQIVANGTDGKSNVITDRVIAGLEIITPKITADTIFAKNIKADHIEGLDVIQDNLAALNEKVSQLSTTSSASTSSTVEQRLLAQLQSASMSATVTQNSLNITTSDGSGLASVSGKLRITGDGFIEGILTVIDTIKANDLLVTGITNFFGDVFFKKNVTFENSVAFSNDIGGQAVINKDDKNVDIVFDKEFDQTPIVNATVTFDQQKDENGKPIPADELQQEYFAQGYSYIIVDKNTKGFTIVLNKKAKDNVNFTWTALRVKDPKNIQSRVIQR